MLKDKLLNIYSKCNGIHKFIIYSLLHIGIIVYTILFSMKDNVDKLNLYSAYLVIGICTVFIIINIVALIIKVKDKFIILLLNFKILNIFIIFLI